METTTPFDLNQAVQDWRENLKSSPAFRCDNLDELQSHLMDSIAALMTRGLSEQEAFSVAAHRLGNCSLLGPEFGKMNRKSVWLDRVLWMLIGIQVWGLLSGLAASAAQSAAFFGFKHWVGLQSDNLVAPAMFLTVFHILCLVGSVGLCWWLLNRNREVLARLARKCLGGRSALLLTAVAICSLSLSVAGAHYVMNAFQALSVGPVEFGKLAMYRQWSALIMVAIQPAIFVALTLFLVHKRLTLTRA
jgi:hypothetical protein